MLNLELQVFSEALRKPHTRSERVGMARGEPNAELGRGKDSGAQFLVLKVRDEAIFNGNVPGFFTAKTRLVFSCLAGGGGTSGSFFGGARFGLRRSKDAAKIEIRL